MGARLTPASWATSPGTRRSMLANRGRDTRPELALRSILHGMGLRYRVALPIALSGGRVRPDVVFVSARLAVFVDGCFWHGCVVHGTRPVSNSDYWNLKIEQNRERDHRQESGLTAMGWR